MSLLSAIAEVGAALNPQLGHLASWTVKPAPPLLHSSTSERDCWRPRFETWRVFARQVLADMQIRSRLSKARKAR